MVTSRLRAAGKILSTNIESSSRNLRPCVDLQLIRRATPLSKSDL
jgi:hypothetical protein